MVKSAETRRNLHTHTHTHTHTCKALLSPKQIGTICFVFSFVFLSQKSFSENIPNNPTCDNSTLGVYSGSAALEPDWGANKIPIRWYNNNTLITDVTAQESECTYDGTIDVASEPRRTGFIFKGWRVRPQMDFSTLSSLGTGLIGYGKGVNGSWCGYDSGDGNYEEDHKMCTEDAHFHDLRPNEWKTEFNTGTMYGMAYCSAKTGNHHDGTWSVTYREDWSATISELDAAQGDKKYCYCLLTGWQPVGETKQYAPDVYLSWIFAFGPTNYCLGDCAIRCSQRFRSYSALRAALFTPAANQ